MFTYIFVKFTWCRRKKLKLIKNWNILRAGLKFYDSTVEL